MNFFSRYLAYLRHNPNGYWFKRKAYGWGWIPVTWQGWCATFLYVLLILSLLLTREKDIPGNPDSGSNFLTLGLPIILLTVLFIMVVYKKGEKPRWQWGIPDAKDREEP